MKRIGFLYPIVCDKGTIRAAIMSASKGKRGRPDVQKVLANIDEHIDALHETLSSETFAPSKHDRATIRDGVHGKEREIFKPRFWPDQVVHWCIYIAIRPTLYKGMYGISCGSIPGRGIHYGKRFVERWVRRDCKGTKYYLKTDVRRKQKGVAQDQEKGRRGVQRERAHDEKQLAGVQVRRGAVGFHGVQILSRPYDDQEVDHVQDHAAGPQGGRERMERDKP